MIRFRLAWTLAMVGLLAPWFGVASVSAQETAAPLSIARQNAAKLIPGLPAELVDAACRQGSVMLYTLIFKDNLAGLSAKFHSEFPCLELHTFTGSGGVLSQRFASEFDSGSVADVWMNSSPAFVEQVAAKNMLLDWSPPDVDRLAEMWRHEHACYAVGLANIGIAWNTSSLTAKQRSWLDQFTHWDQLPSAPFADDLAIVDIRAGGTTQLPYYAFTKLYGPDFWQKLAALHPTKFSAINPLAERLAAGEFDFVVASTADTAIATQWLKGAPVRWKFPEPGLAVPYCIGISSRAPHTDAAKLFLAWSLSADGQEAWVVNSGLAPAGPDVRDDRRFAHEPWYKLPHDYYSADWTALSAEMPADTARFIGIFGH